MNPKSDRREWVLAALDQFEGRLLRYAQRLLGNLDEARDVVQFAFLRLCDQSPDQIGDRLAQWLYTVCRNRALDLLRTSGREKSNGHVVERRVAVVCAASHGSPADLAEQAELHELLRMLVEELPASQREALDLWADGFTYIEISRIIDKQEGHVRVLVHRGLKTLREHPRIRTLIDDEKKDQEKVPVKQPELLSLVHGASPN